MMGEVGGPADFQLGGLEEEDPAASFKLTKGMNRVSASSLKSQIELLKDMLKYLVQYLEVLIFHHSVSGFLLVHVFGICSIDLASYLLY